jgi:hypothetical protein
MFKLVLKSIGDAIKRIKSQPIPIIFQPIPIMSLMIIVAYAIFMIHIKDIYSSAVNIRNEQLNDRISQKYDGLLSDSKKEINALLEDNRKKDIIIANLQHTIDNVSDDVNSRANIVWPSTKKYTSGNDVVTMSKQNMLSFDELKAAYSDSPYLSRNINYIYEIYEYRMSISETGRDVFNPILLRGIIQSESSNDTAESALRTNNPFGKCHIGRDGSATIIAYATEEECLNATLKQMRYIFANKPKLTLDEFHYGWEGVHGGNWVEFALEGMSHSFDNIDEYHRKITSKIQVAIDTEKSKS